MNTTFRPCLITLSDRLVPTANPFVTGPTVMAPIALVADPVTDTHAIRIDPTGEDNELWSFGDVADWTNHTVNVVANKTVQVVKIAADTVVDGVNTAGKAVKGAIYPDPLSAFRRQYVSTADLRPGDILLEASGGAKAGVIGFFTGSDYSHAAIYVGDGRIVEAVGSGVRQNSVKGYLNDDGIQRVMVIRVPGLNAADEADLVAFAEKQIGKSYNTAGAAALPGRTLVKAQTFGLVDPRATPGNSERPTYYCSELLTAAYQSINRPLFTSLQQSPGDLADLPALDKARVIGSLYDAVSHREERM